MKSRIIISIAISVLVFPFCASSLSAQSFLALLEKLENIENRLAGLETSTKRDISQVESQIKEIKTSPEQDISAENSTITLLESQIALLSDDIKAIQESAGNDEQSKRADEVVTLAMDLRGLVGELRGTIESSRQGQPGVSIEPEAESGLAALDITGFGDFGYSAHRGQDGQESFSLGQAEVDIETSFNEVIVLTAALAFEAAEGTFGLGQLTFDFHMFGSEGGHLRKINGIDHSGIIVGQFDVPFGLDWQVYPSIDRKMVTGPMVVASTHDSWNDYGVQFYAANKWFNAVAYGLNGFGYDEVEMNASTGGRLGVKPHQWIEFGTSYAGFFNSRNQMDMSLLGFDIQFNYNSLQLKGEYITRKFGIAGDQDAFSNSGFYGQGLYDFGKLFLFGRYGMLSPFEPVEKDIKRFSGGGGFVVTEGVEFRLEHQLNSVGDDQTYLQAVVGF